MNAFQRLIAVSFLMPLVCSGSLWGQELRAFQNNLEQMSKGISLEKVSLLRIYRNPEPASNGTVTHSETTVDYSLKVMDKQYVFNQTESNRINDEFFTQNLFFNDYPLAIRNKSKMNELDSLGLKEIKNTLANLSSGSNQEKRRKNYFDALNKRDEILERDAIKTTLADGCIVFNIGYWNQSLKIKNTIITRKRPAEYVLFPQSTHMQQSESTQLARDYGALVSAGLIDSDPLMLARIYASGVPLDVWTQLCPPSKAEQNPISIGMKIATLDPENASIVLGAETNRLLPFPDQTSLIPADRSGYINSQNPIQPKPLSYPEFSYNISNKDWVMGGMHPNGRTFATAKWPLAVGLGVIVAVQYLHEAEPRIAYFDLSGGIIKISNGKLIPGFLVRSNTDSHHDWPYFKTDNAISWNGDNGFGFENLIFKSATMILTKPGTGSENRLEALLNELQDKDANGAETVKITRSRWVQPRALN